MFYISKKHLNYSKEEFLDATLKEITGLWKKYLKENGLTTEQDKQQNNSKVKKVNIDELSIF